MADLMQTPIQKEITAIKNMFLSKMKELDIIKHGTFTLKNGTTSNIYMDFRKLVNYPSLYKYLDNLINLIFPDIFQHDTKLMPIPFGGIPFGNYLSFARGIPQVMVRNKPKDHGTKKLIEGEFTNQDNFIIIEDVITSGTSICETLDNISTYYTELSTTTNIKQEPPTYKSILCICNRGNLTDINGIPIYSIFTLSEIQQYIEHNSETSLIPLNYFKYGSYFADKLYTLALVKHSNIILSCDFMTPENILDMIPVIGNLIVGVKLHLDIIPQTNNNFYKDLTVLQDKYKFMIIDDAKFADIESITLAKINHSRLEITKIANALTLHAIAGLSIADSGKTIVPGIIVSEMSSSSNMISSEYTRKIIEYIRGKNPNDISIGGLVIQRGAANLNTAEILTMTPGIALDMAGDGANQQYSIPDVRSNKRGLFWIVGRGITTCKGDVIENTEKYRSLGWEYFIRY